MFTTSRLGLEGADGTTAVSGYPAIDLQAKNILDQAAVYKEGTLASRTNPTYDGQLYKTTDTGAESLSWFDGSVWLPLGLIPAVKSASGSVVSGQAILTSGSSAITITLPAHANGQIVAVKNGSTGGTTVSGSSIQGIGLSSASSFPLGAVGASAVLIDDGTNWNFLAGQQDTGWLALTLSSPWSHQTGAPAAARHVGNRVSLRSTLSASAPITSLGSTIATLPTGVSVPNTGFALVNNASSIRMWLQSPGIAAGDTDGSSGAIVYLDQITYLTD